jgi:hypothetical protein
MQPREFAEMVEEGIREAAAIMEVPCVVVRPLLLGVKVAAYLPWLTSFLADFACFARVIFQI